MGITITHSSPALVLSLSSDWNEQDVHAALAAMGTRQDAVVFDFTSSRSTSDLQRALTDWGVELLAFAVHDDRMAEAVMRYQSAAVKVHVCESVPEALRWIEKVRAGVAAAVQPVRVEAAHQAEDAPAKPLVPWPTRLYRIETLTAAVALLRALEAEATDVERPPSVEPAGRTEHLEAFQRAAGLLPADVRNVYTLTTRVACAAGKLDLDFTKHPPNTIEFGAERFLVVNGESEGLVLQVHPEICRLWQVEHDGPSLTLVERGVDAWLVRSATLELLEQDYEQQVRAALAMGTAMPERRTTQRDVRCLEARPVADVRKAEPAHSSAHAWLVSLPDRARIYDFRQAAPGTEVAGVWSDGEWTCHGELWAVT